MKIFIKYSLIITSLFWLCGCIEPYDVKIDKQEKMLVVNGLITNEPGPYTIKLTTSYNYGDYFGAVDPYVDGATVSIQDETGNSEILIIIEAVSLIHGPAETKR